MRLESVLLNANRGFSVHAQPRQPMELRVGLLVFSANRSAPCSRSLPRAMSHETDQFVPSQREDFTDPQSGHCRKNNDRAERFVTRSYESSNFFRCKKPVRTFQRSLWHLYAAHGVIQDVIPIDSCS